MRGSSVHASCGRRRRIPSTGTRSIGGLLAVALVVLTGCTSTTTASTTSSGSSKPPIPSSAFSDHTGVTPSTVTIANISTQTGGLFKGAAIGTQAYAAYVDSVQGGVNGRKIVVQASDDQFTGSTNKQLTEAAVQSDFATVGSFSVQDSFGGFVLAANPQMPNVSVAVDAKTAALPNTFGGVPAAPGWPLGPLTYFQKKFPEKVSHTATIVADLPSTLALWNSEKAAMQHLGYKVLYDPALPASTTDFTAQIVTMKDMGVQILFLEQEPQNYASAVIKDLNQQDFHPVVVLGAAAYSPVLVANSGGAAAIDGSYLEQSASYYLGEDAAAIPAITTFNTWVQKVAPGFQPDFFTLEGWLCAQLFTQALHSAGADPSRGSVLEALRHITAFSSDGLIPVSNPAEKIPVSCYLIGRIENGKFVRLDDPPIDGPTHGFRCDEPFYYVK